MIRVLLELEGEGTFHRVRVRAESIEQAVSRAMICRPGCVARVLFPIDPEDFSVRGEDSLLNTIQPEASVHERLPEPRHQGGS